MIEIEEYVDVNRRSEELGLKKPEAVSIIPRNYFTAASSEELIHESEAATFKILIRKSGLEYTPVEDEKIGSVLEQGSAIIMPILMLSSTVITQNPELIDVLLNLISEYIYDKIRGTSKNDEVDLEYIVETKKGEYKKLKYRGNSEGIKEVSKIIKSVNDD